MTNAQAGTRIDEIAAGIYRISSPVPPNPALPGGFTFNQFLIVDDEPLLFHTGLRRMFPLTREAVASVMPVDKLRWVSFSHFEADECGSLAEWLGDRNWFIVDRPTKVDATALGLLAVSIRSPLPTPVCTYARSKPNLVAFVERALARWFPELANTLPSSTTIRRSAA